MKKQILKIAGVKSEKEFYKKYPTEEAFMKAHGKAFKKAQIGAYIGGEQGAGFQPVNFKDVYDEADYAITGSTEDMRKEEAYRQAELAAAQEANKGGGGGGPLGAISSILQSEDLMKAFGGVGGEGGAEGMAALAGGMGKKGKKLIKKSQGGTDLPRIQTPTRDQLLAGTSPAGSITPSATPSSTVPEIEMAQGSEFLKNISKYAGPTGELIQGIQALKEEKKALQRARQARDVSGLVRQAASTRPEQTERKYVRPEDITNTGEEFFPIYGVGTNVLAKDGRMIGGIPGEIANTFAPNTLYDDLAYEPLNDSQRYKQFYHGGKMHTAQTGLEMFAQAGGGDVTSKLIGGITGENAGGNIGGTIGKTAGMLIGGPVGAMIGQVGGQLIGSALDRKPQQIKKAKSATQRNIQATAFQQGLQGAQGQYTSFMEDGGTTSPYQWMSHTWQPQVIATFGEHKVSDLLRPPKDADMLRAGGHLKEYTPPSARAMFTGRPVMEMGGDLKIDDRGDIEFMGYNPETAKTGASGFIGISRGPSHDNGGFNLNYSGNEVEIEGGETIMEKKDGGPVGDTSLNVLGNLKTGILGEAMLQGVNEKTVAKLLKGRKIKDVKYKHLGNDIAKKTKSLNKQGDRYSELASSTDNNSVFDKLALNSAQAGLMGIQMQYKDLNTLQDNLMIGQAAINDTAEELGLIADDLAKGKVKIDKKAMKEGAKYGKEIQKAQFGGFFGPIMAPMFGVTKAAPTVVPTLRALAPGGSSVAGLPSSGISLPPASAASPKAATNAAVSTVPLTAATAIRAYQAPVDEEVDDDGLLPIDEPVASAPARRATAAPASKSVNTSSVQGEDERVKQIMDLYEKAKEANAKNPGKKNSYALELQKKFHEYFPEIAERIITSASDVTGRGKAKGIRSIDDLKKLSRAEILDTNLDEYFGPRTEQYIANLPKKTPTPTTVPSGELKVEKQKTTTGESTTKVPDNVSITPYKRNALVDIIGQVVPYLRPTDQEELDPRQLMGEMYALATNQLEPVQAQLLQPQLSVPYDISLQDILNENEATFRAQQRMLGYNPAAQSDLAARKYAANQKVLGEQFRLNQAMKDQVYRENRNLLNEFGLKNLEILDRQYERQARAKSTTKAITQAALNSIGDKYMRNQLENRTLAVMENLYNYRYDPRFRAVNMNAPYQFSMPTVYAGPGQQGIPVLDREGNVITIEQQPAIPSTATPPLVPTNTVPAAAPSATPVQPVPPPIDFEEDMLTEDELKGGRKGLKMSKKKGLNRSILKAFKNL